MPPINLSPPDLNTLVPEIIVTVLAVVLMLGDLFLSIRQKPLLIWVSVIGYVLALIACVSYFFSSNLPMSSFAGMIVLDKLGLWLRILALLSALLGVFFATNYMQDKGMPLGDFYAVLALATLGMMIVGASQD